MKKWMSGIAVAAVLAVGWWLVSPLLHEDSVMSTHMEDKDSEMNGMKDDKESEEMMDTEEESSMDSMKEEDSTSQDGNTNDTMEKSDSLMGTLMGADASHEAMGKVKVSGKNVQLENFEVTNGPDLYVYLVEDGQKTKDGHSLGKLKGNMGNQNYQIPENISAAERMKIVIWCKQFNEDFGVAELSKGM